MITGFAAGVPYVALEPADPSRPAPMIAVWHLMDPPCTEQAMAAAVPMAGLPAWRVYFGLPMTGRRALPGGPEEFFRLASEDAVMNAYRPQTEQGADEFPKALAELRTQLSIADGPVGIAGGSSGSMVAYEVAARAEVPIFAAAFVSPVTQLVPLVAANERRYGVTFPWNDENRAVANHYDYVRRAAEIKVPALLVVGEHDDIAIREPAELLHKESDAELVTIPGMRHELADAPGTEAAPQTEDARRVDAELIRFFQRHLG
ncbi:alpha/beta fold hydrolase [Actinocrispum wychmicini]|uniref:Prolyl oligopeptidase family protein n=1 Tax=Actinocrispum wychmicini TaxID=1213861 RepID=A0A4R2J8U1_9PSEU|nr:prolyl oligopeptidase family serine peptidase [Actinocrispum wychmicini]TCO53026.1 prolyl oligopeptidase family protein [Actinocrispum wychmicini]